MPRKSTYKIEATKPKDPIVTTKSDEEGRNPIMPQPGPKTLAERLGADKVHTIKILPPTCAKVIKGKTPASNPFMLPPRAAKHKKR
jgi:hypothetical protein